MTGFMGKGSGKITGPEVGPVTNLATDKSLPKGLPVGTVSNSDGTFTLPDGTRVRPK
jgi:hypothetical protein